MRVGRDVARGRGMQRLGQWALHLTGDGAPARGVTAANLRPHPNPFPKRNEVVGYEHRPEDRESATRPAG